MKNKVTFKKYLTVCIAILILFTILFLVINWIEYRSYNRNVNIVINQIIANIQKQYPNTNINEIIKILNQENKETPNLLQEYGINMQTDSAILQNDNNYIIFLGINMTIILLLLIGIILIFMKYQKSQNKKINEITKYIEAINNKVYTLDICDNDEDELSILKNELYKITVMLKEQAENSKKDKIELKKSLEDISHQLKTPLTSITIMLDNILDNPDMDMKKRNEFLKNIYREVTNINFFVQSLLKLSRFDADTIVFHDKEEDLKDIVEEAVKNVLPLSDLRNVEIIVKETEVKTIALEQEKTLDEKQLLSNRNENTEKVNNLEIKNNKKKDFPRVWCDVKWQVEAITNILKNSVEHSKENSKVIISYEENKMYSEIKITDTGIGMDKEDQKHIFERFYKGKNSNKDSIGIGLALAKTIVEKDNGYITVDSELGKGTIFKVRYLK